ncbi:cytochrome P450 monooxygenase [Eremomyces bilateralis CBS 781.70]|uniref:Cytochrome P450 monooxygenase n=1 Tax=Eremomyces bilateralis CBS 781.70 TaxID=1392243 RepID=A0A6G1G2U3_9PEZI|nr:cytochrome P450 monooxygenase [Eremomyces bilateralis CBS 781.70]KAF1812236.1 cytochrome P450 monooxygenase [Eremomyces bilateralis CBS 781.70]
MLSESAPFAPTLAVLTVILFLLYKYVVHPALFSPLSRIPGAHWSTSLSPVWILWTRYKSMEIRTLHQKHHQLGPVIRLGPNDISVNCVKGGISTVYAGGFEKHAWYSNLFNNYGVPNMFSTCQGRPHSVRKRMMSNVYSKSYMHGSKAMIEITTELIYRRLLVRFEEYSSTGKDVDIYKVSSAITMDFVTAFLFGLASSSNLTMDDERRDWFLELYNSRRKYNFWPHELPNLTKIAKWACVPLVPKWVDGANATIESWTLEMCDGASKAVGQQPSSKIAPSSPDFPIVYAQLDSAIRDGRSKQDMDSDLALSPLQRLTIASEMLDQLAAGFDTSGITLTYAIHELSHHPHLQNLLRSSLTTLTPPITPLSTPSLPSPKALDALPLLHAILYETLRLHAAIPGAQPRITPGKPCILGTAANGGEYFDIPAGVRISAQAWSLHRNEEVFPQAEEWRVGRWLKWRDESGRAGEVVDVEMVGVGELRWLEVRNDVEMNRWFWAFGSGGRMCIGSNLAMYQMKSIMACLYGNFTTRIVDDEGIEQRDAYTAPPKGEKLIIRLEASAI